MKNILSQFEKNLGKGRIKLDEPLSSHTTFRIGGPAKFYFEAQAAEELARAMKSAKTLSIPSFILGGGSNILVGDKGFPGLVIKNQTRNIKILGYRGNVKGALRDKQISTVKTVLIEAESGVPFNQLVRFAIEEELGGLEGFLGLPGTVGGAVFVNAHWQEMEIRDLVVSMELLTENGVKIPGCLPSQLRGLVILSAVVRLEKGEKEVLWEKARKVVEYRQQTQPLNSPSAGCIFRNIKKSEATRLGLPNLTTSAGFLIEAVGLKGQKIGKVQIPPQHANFIVNLGGGKATDVIELIEMARVKVKEKFGVELEEEILRVGEF